MNSAYTCSICTKSFTTQKGLQSHARVHKSPIEETKISTEIYHCRGCVCKRDVHEISKDDHIASKTQQIGTSQLFNIHDLTSYNARTYKFADELPKKILDLQFTLDKQLIAIDQSFQVLNLSKLNIFNQYKEDPIDLNNRVTFGIPEILKKTSLFDYQYDDRNGTRNKLSLVRNDKIGTISKFLAENEVTFEYPQITPIYWDLETYNEKDFEFSEARDPDTIISMLVAVRNNHAIVWILNKYTHNIDQIRCILETKTELHIEVEIIECDNDVEIAHNFMYWLQQLKTFHYLTGFNATQSTLDKDSKKYPNCYDMQLIIRKAGLNPRHFRVSKQQWFNQQELAYVSHKSLPLIQFIDFKQLAQPHVAIFEGRLGGYKLDNILEFMEIPCKITANHIDLRKSSRLDNYNMSHYISYCIYDCLSLQLADQKHKLFEQQYTFCKMLQMPASSITNMSTAQKLQVHVIKLYVEQNYSLHFSYLDYQETRPKFGAETRAVQKEDQFKYISNMIACDYASQYPNAIVQLNIGHETIRLQQTTNSVDINYLRGDVNIVYFDDKNESIASKFARKLLVDKTYYKSIGNIPLEKSSKLAVNTFYGLFNQDSSPLYSYECASSITGFGRFMLTHAQSLFIDSGYTILSMDTDGLEIVPINPIKTVEDIGQEITSRYPRFVLEFEKGNECIFNSKKKSYLKRKLGKELTLKDLGNLKGFGSKNKLSVYMRNQIVNFCNLILDSKPSKISQILDKINIFKQSIYEEINRCIDQGQNLEDFSMIHKYTKSNSKSGNLTKSGYLERKHGAKSIYKIIPYNRDESKKDHNFIEYNDPELDISKIQTHTLVDMLCQPITQFFEATSITKELKNELKDGQIILRVEPYNQMQIVDIVDVKSVIIASKNKQVYHEKILSNTCKLYFDLETKRKQIKDTNNNISYGKIHPIQIELFQKILFEQLGQTYNIHIADGCTGINQHRPEQDKYSYHVIVDVIMAKSQMQSLARRINKLYSLEIQRLKSIKKEQQTTEMKEYHTGICDLQVYSDDASFRLPLQHKLGKKTVLKIITNSTFEDFIVQNIKATYPNLQNPIAFTKKSHFGLFKHKKANSNALKYVETKFGLKCDLYSNYILAPIQKPYKCPLSGNVHTSQNLQVKGNQITCFSEKCKECKPIEIPEDSKIIEPVKWERKLLPESHIVDMPNITFNIDSHRFTFIKSQMGTGKTKHLLKELGKPQYNDMYIIAISFRKTFATDFSNKMNFANYQQLQRQISLFDTPRVIVQIDSLHRISLDNINPHKIILILDEVESINDQSQAFSEKPLVQKSFQALYDILRSCNKMIALDAYMQARTPWLYNTMASNSNYQIIHNIHAPKLDFKAAVYMDRATDKFKADYQQNIIKRLKEGKNVVSFCSNYTIAKGLCELANDLGIKYKFYHGKDERFENCHQESNMYDAKMQDFQNVSVSFKVQLLVYTSTMSAGISFEEKHFHHSINYFAYDTCTATTAVQAMQRVRNIEDESLTLYIEITQKSSIQQTAFSIAEDRIKIYNQFHVYAPIRELTMYFDARINEQVAHKNELTLDFIQDQGYTLQLILDHQYIDQKPNKPILEIDYSVQLQEEDLNLLKQLKSKDYLKGNKDRTLSSRIHLVCLYKSYNYKSIAEFNQLDIDYKKDLQANKSSQIEIKAWKKIQKIAGDAQITLENAIDIARQYERKLDIEQRFLAQIEHSISQKKRDTFVLRIENIQHCNTLKKLQPEEMQEYISKKGSKFVKVFNQIMEPIFKYKIKSKQVRCEGKLIRQYELIHME